MSQGLNNRLDVSLAVILGLAFCVRLIALWTMPDVYMPDTIDYLVDGDSMFLTGQTNDDKYMPLYSILAYITGGEMGLKMADILLSTLTVWIIYETVHGVFESRPAAIVAALVAAMYPHFVFFSIARLSETLYLFLTCWAFLLLYRQRLFWGAVVLVLSILTRPTIYLLAPILIMGFSIAVWRMSLTQSFKNVGLYLALYLVLMSPWWLHNYNKYDTFVHLILGDGLVLYSGNNPLNTTGGGVAVDGVGDMDITAFKKIPDPLIRNQAYKDAALDFILENPGRFVELAGLKFVRFWRLWPFAPEYQQPHIIVASLLSYGSILILAVGFFYRRPFSQIMRVTPLVLFAAYLTLVHMVTIGSIRYRLPVEPFLIILASITLCEILNQFPLGQRLVARLSAAGKTR